MQQFQVDKQDLSQHRIVATEDAKLSNQGRLNQTLLKETSSKEGLSKKGVTFEVERFAFTANNLTYFMMGEKLGYWQFFPAFSDKALADKNTADNAATNKSHENNVSDKWGLFLCGG